MIKIPPKNGDPEIFLYKSLEEMRESLGYPYTHGLFDQNSNRIHATSSSLAHEIAHFKDYRSGRMINSNQLKNTADRNKARIRNEVVAILYAWKKNPDPTNFLKHEIEFMELYFYIPNQPEGLNLKDPKSLHFSEIQDAAELLLNEGTPWLKKLQKIFFHYLEEESENLKAYGR